MNPKNTGELFKGAYIRDPQLTMEALVKQVVAKVGENITVAKFTRLALGEYDYDLTHISSTLDTYY